MSQKSRNQSKTSEVEGEGVEDGEDKEVLKHLEGGKPYKGITIQNPSQRLSDLIAKTFRNFMPIEGFLQDK